MVRADTIDLPQGCAVLSPERYLLPEERKAFLESASTVVVDIYSKMKSDAAAPQLAKLGNENAAMILVRLKPRQASDILSEMDPAVAAEVAKLMSRYKKILCPILLPGAKAPSLDCPELYRGKMTRVPARQLASVTRTRGVSCSMAALQARAAASLR